MELIRALMVLFVSFFILAIVGQALGGFWLFVILVLGFLRAYEERTKK